MASTSQLQAERIRRGRWDVFLTAIKE